MKKTMSILVSAALLLTAAGCGGGSNSNNPADAPKVSTGAAKTEDPVKIRIAWWGGQSRNDYTLKVIEMYKKLHPNVTIEAEYAPYDDYWKKLAPQAAANQLPDIIQMDFSYLTQYGGRGQLEDLTPYTSSGVLNVADVSENALSSGKLNDKLLAMNLGVNALATIVDTAAFQKVGATAPTTAAGWNWDDLDILAEKVKAAGKIMGGAAGHQEVFFSYYLREQEQKLYADDGTQLGYSDDKPFIDYFTRYQKWYDSGALLTLDKEVTKKNTPEEDETALGNSVSTWTWSNQLVGIAGVAKREGIELAPLPGPNANKGLFLKPSMFFSVTKSSKVKEEAAKFISFWINDIEANKLIKGDRGVPVSSNVVAAVKPILTPNEAKVFDYVAWADKNSSPIDPPPPVGSVEVEKLLKDINEQIMFKKLSVQDAAAKFRKDANAVLAKKNKK